MTGGLDVTVAIPAFRDRDGLARLLDRLEAMGAALEILVVDDASEDGTAEMVETRAPAPGIDLRLLRNETNLGPGPSRNRAIEAASRRHLLFIDADDLPHRDLFLWAADAPPGPEAEFTLFRHHLCPDPARPFTYRMTARDEAAWACARAARGDLNGAIAPAETPLLTRMIAFPWTRLFRTDFLQDRGIRFPDLRLHEDVPFHWDAWLLARRFHVLDHAPPLIHHFQPPDGERATHAVDARRLDAFRALAMVQERREAELTADPGVAAAFLDFAADLALWVLSQLRRGEHAAESRRRAGELLAALDALADRAEATFPGRDDLAGAASGVPEAADA